MSGASRQTLGFGFDPDESPYHFVLILPLAAEPVRIVERFVFGEAGPLDEEPPAPVQKVSLRRAAWERVEAGARAQFSERLRRAGLRAADFRPGENLLAPYFGKELTLLAWAIELELDEAVISKMLVNWLGLVPEERWWLYATVNASFNDSQHGPDRGWRKAIKIAFAENPIKVAEPHIPERRKREPPTAPQPSAKQLAFDTFTEPPEQETDAPDLTIRTPTPHGSGSG